MLKPPRSTPDLAEHVYAQLRDAIVAGQLQPGERLAQEDLAAQFGISRQPVLQGLAQLERDGLAVRGDGRGTLRVAPLDPELVSHFYELRAEIDTLAARRAAERVAAGQAPPLSGELLARGTAALAQGRMAALIQADTHLHHAIYQASGNPLITRVMAPQWRHLERVMGAVLQTHALRAGLWDEHRDIVAAINAGQAQRAAALSREHAVRAGQGLLPRLARALGAHGHEAATA
ncbi:GntR family transcriptional regulator [Orrella sp. JC864]|uniref:GntR family transcriptional regulator n=1 Tax=Orrella sp. JC864 TaxID=3120298 RepID=UPI00300A26EA